MLEFLIHLRQIQIELFFNLFHFQFHLGSLKSCGLSSLNSKFSSPFEISWNHFEQASFVSSKFRAVSSAIDYLKFYL